MGDRLQIPVFDKIEIKDALPCDILLFYYGNKLTEWHGRYRRKEFGRSELPPYHTAIVYDNNTNNDNDADKIYICDPEITTSLSLLSEYTTKTAIRIDVFRYRKTVAQTLEVMKAMTQIVREEHKYDAKGCGFFLSQMPGCGWMKYILPKPSETDYFCSDAVTYCMQERGGIQVSKYDHNRTAPIDNQLYGMNHPDDCSKFTLKERTQ